MNPLESLIQQLSNNAGIRGFTYAGRVAQPGMSLGDILSMPSTIGDLEEGGKAANIASTNKLTPVPQLDQYRNTFSNVNNMAKLSNASNAPNMQQIETQANAEQATLLNRIQELYNYLFPYKLNMQNFLPSNNNEAIAGQK